MRRIRTTVLLAATSLVACVGGPDGHTLAELREREADISEVAVENSLDQAMVGYRRFLEEAPESALTPEAMRRLADLELEKEYGILGDGQPAGFPAPAPTALVDDGAAAPDRSQAAGVTDLPESDADFERRAIDTEVLASSGEWQDAELPGGRHATSAGPLGAIALYDEILASYPNYAHNDQVLYQKARAYDELGETDEAIAVIERLIAEYPHSRHIDEAQFRRAEYFFTRRRYLDAERAYAAIKGMGAGSEYYELALYKLGWAYYKQELHEEALDEYVALLDYKVSTGYDFDHAQDEDEERRIADTYRVISLSFSNLGGPEAVGDYFGAKGKRTYEDRIYSHLGEFYLEKLRYDDAAKSYRAFVALNPFHRASPRFGMRVVEIYEAGDFPKLVLESRKEFAATYGLQSEYWRHFDVDDSPEVLSYLKANLADLANHYHALYQATELADEKPANFQEATRWYQAYLTSFPAEPGSPAINHRLADLLLEHEDFAEAAREYERTAYGYPAHEGDATAGYAAIYAHREHQKRATGAEQEAVRRDAVTSSLRFVEKFPQHEHAAAVLGAAADDLYAMKEFAQAIATGRKLIDGYPGATPAIRRSAWTVVAHSSFEVADYAQAEPAYAQVLELTPADDAARSTVVDNLAATIYKQGEQANQAGDHRSAADHFLRIGTVAPHSGIQPAAEYDAAAALIRLQDWAGAAAVLESFRQTFPDHELSREATKQIAFVYREAGNLSRAAAEYERVAVEAGDPELRREALLAAGALYEDAKLMDRALAVYLGYVSQFPEPIEIAVETRFKIAGMYEAARDPAGRHEQLRQIVEIDAAAGGERTARVRFLAARSALTLAESLYERFGEVTLVQPFERNLQEKQQRMSTALEAFGGLVDYEVGDVTAAATFYMAEIYHDFGRALNESERPTNLGAAELQGYETALEEEAFPFEERAIEVHEKNLELMAAGLYNPWIEKSLARLAVLMPGRYARFEASSGFIDSVDSYVYRAPVAPVRAVESEIVEAAPGTPVAAPGETESGEASVPPAEAAADARSEVVEVAPADPEPVAAEGEILDATPTVPADAADVGEVVEAAPSPPAAPASDAAVPVPAEPAGEPAMGENDASPR